MEQERLPTDRKIDPGRRTIPEPDKLVPVHNPGNPAHGEWARDGYPEPDMEVIRGYRLERIRQQLRERDVAGCLLYDPLNIRYATDTSNMQVWCLHNPVRYCFVATDGPVVLFDFHGCTHLSDDFPKVDETRNAVSWYYFGAGPEEENRARIWAGEIADLVKSHGSGNRRLLIDKCDKAGISALTDLGISCHSSQAFAEEARKIKHREEVKAMRRAIHTSEVGIAEMWKALKPGMTENQLWSILHQVNIARGGEWIETRLLASGPRTNPWFRECSDRVIEAGDIVAFDTDLIGPYGYCSDISRTWVTPGRQMSNDQANLHAIAGEQIAFNADLVRPGVAFRELSEKGFKLPDDCYSNRYSVMMHGVGLCDEYPSIVYPTDFETGGYDGNLEAGMCICLESYIGTEGGMQGVKLERQALVTADGIEFLDVFPTGLTPEI